MDTTASARVLLGNVNKEILNEITTNYVNFYQFLRKLRENEKWQEVGREPKEMWHEIFDFKQEVMKLLRIVEYCEQWTYDPEVSR